MPETPPITPIDTVEVRRSPEYRVIYSNLIKTRIGAGEVTAIFSKITHNPSPEVAGNIIEEQAEIIMSWPQLKMVAQILTSLVIAIEQEVGPIPISLDFQINQARQNAIVAGLKLRPVESG